jgi:hypothetical protein
MAKELSGSIERRNTEPSLQTDKLYQLKLDAASFRRRKMTHAVLAMTTIQSWKWSRFAIGIALILVTCAGGAFAQNGQGSIQGTILDPTGAVIQDASIHVVNTKTGVTSDSITNRAGFYEVPALFTGNYNISITSPGMKTSVRTLELLVGQDAVINFTMATGSVSQEVVVQGNLVQMVTQDNGAITSTLENSRINQLPMNGRDLTTLIAETTPGVGPCTNSPACANGLPSGAIEFSADGVDLNQREFGGAKEGQAQLPDADAVEQIKVLTVAGGAEYSTPAAAVITTKSGTNALHGTFFETARNNALGLARDRQDPSNFIAPHLVRNEFGASLGGPIVIPHLYNGKNKSFWFFSYERYSLAQDHYNNENVPTQAMKNGDFSGLISGSGILSQLYDPLTTASSANCNGTGQANQWCRQPFTNNQIPTARESPTAKILMDITPLPSSAANPLVASNLSYKATDYYTRPSVTFRVDHVFTQNTRAYVRYTENIEQQISNSFSTLAADGFPAGVSGISSNPDKLYAYALGVSHIFSPTFFSETTLSQNWFAKQDTAGPAGLTDFASKLGMPDNFGEPGFPAFKDILSPLAGTQTAYSMTQTISTIQEHLTKIIGKHQLLFGFDDRYEHFGSRPDERQNDALFDGLDTALENPTSGQNYTATPHTGDENGDEFLGGAYDYTYNLEAQYQHINDNSADAYIQDNYRIRPNLTLNLGLRYEAHPSITTSNGEMLGFDLKNDAIVLGAPISKLISEGLTTQAIITNNALDGVKFETAAEAGYPSSLLDSYNFTWGPRFGIAWLPFSSHWGTVLRGGVGRYIYPEPVRSQLVDIVKNDPFAASYGQNYALASQSPDSLQNYILRSRQTVTLGVNSSNAVNTSTTNAILPGLAIKSLDPKFAPNYVTEGNVTIEQPLKWNSALRVSYVFTRGVNVNQDHYYNNNPSSYVWEMQTGTAVPTGSVIGSNQYAATATGPYDQTPYGGGSFQQVEQGWSNYNALQVNYQKLYHAGVAWQFSYVFSKLLDTGVGSSYYPYANYVDTGLGTMTPAYGPVQTPVAVPGLPTGVPNWGFYHSLDRFENYGLDTGNPIQSIKFNGILDFPFGRGKHFFGGVNKFVDELIGGWQLAGDGGLTSQNFSLTSTNWGPAEPLKIYKKSMPVTDCRSGVCIKDYLWFNGYIAPTVIAGNPCAAAAGTNVIYGLPSGYIPYQSPIDTGCNAAGHDTYFGDNEVNITLANGKTSAITYSPSPGGSNPFSHTVVSGPLNFNADLSLFKVFPITRRVFLRVNVDAFNAFNIQGPGNPSGSNGLLTYQAGGVGASSFNAPRQIQLTARLTF